MSALATPSLPKQLVLIVDDDLTMRLLARITLEQDGFRVEEAADGAAGVEAFERLRPDIVLLDVQMPVLDGFLACAALRKLDGGDHVPVLMMTGLDDSDSINRAYEVGATDFIAKPIAWPMLGHRVRYMLRANRAFVDLTQSQARLINAQRIAQLGHWEWDLVSDKVECSGEIYRILGLNPAHYSPTSLSLVDIVHPDDRSALRDALQATLRCKAPLNLDVRIVQPDGTIRIVHQQGEVSYDANGKPVHMQGTVQDITERKNAAEQIRQLALYDSLTGLPNRYLFKEQLSLAVASARRTDQVLVMLSLDLDRFKRVNDTLGHEGGDMLLKEAANRLGKSLRTTDYVARDDADVIDHSVGRPGGDEFTVLLPVKRPQDGAKVARRILDALSQPFTLGANDIVVSASIGIAIYPLDGSDADSLLRNADTAMHFAKDQGKNNCQYYNGTMNASAVERLSLESKLHHALERDEFSLFYQPKIDVKTHRVVGAEALIRWRHPELGLVSPAEFIPLAEETGLIIPIGEWVLRTACAQIREWQQAGLAPVPIAVNISPKQFHQQNIAEVVMRALREHDVDPTLLDIEITESTAMRNAEATSATLRDLKALGVRIAIDDFGTGYSSLSYLKRFPIDSLKIDRSFVTGLPGDQDDASIAQAVITMAHALRLKVVAEGVETEAQQVFLAAHDCDEMQGFYFSRPLPVEQCTELLRDQSTLPVKVAGQEQGMQPAASTAN
ncbi:MAG TPA: EAL domain-containing protein [Burkholderiales bacterium]|nr:EAL domain-containing protein [Burkholderiales bacterium]